MVERKKLPKFRDLNKLEKGLMISSLIFTLISIVLVFLYKLNVIKYNIWYFTFAITCLILSIIYFKYDRITAILSLLMLFLMIGMGLKEFGL